GAKGPLVGGLSSTPRS
ncbi:hypothetical protein Zm00014a_023765, partial [Zea mays]